MKNKKLAFTLGEVLITVAIVGLIAALTIPNLNKNINEDKYISLMKTTMSILDTAVIKVVSEYGSIENAEKSCGNDVGSIQCFGQLLTKYLDTRKTCSSSDTSCFSTEAMKEIDGSTVKGRENASDICVYNFILSNGVAVCIRDYFNFNNYTLNNRIDLDIDIDGPNAGPNMRGVDNFDLIASNDGVSYFIVDKGIYDLSSAAVNRGIDRGFDIDYDSVAWAFLNGNMDYLRCADQLKWHSKKTCD